MYKVENASRSPAWKLTTRRPESRSSACCEGGSSRSTTIWTSGSSPKWWRSSSCTSPTRSRGTRQYRTGRCSEFITVPVTTSAAASAGLKLARDAGRSRPNGGLRLQIDDHVGHGELDVVAGSPDDPPLEPPRAVGRMGRDDDLVRGKGAQRVLDGYVRIGVAYLAPRPQSQSLDRPHRVRPPGLRGLDRLVDIRQPVLDRRGDRRRHHQDLALPPPAPVLDLAQQRPPADRLVGDHEHPVDCPAAAGDLGLRALAAPRGAPSGSDP